MEPVLSPYLNFSGKAADAMKFYQSILGGELTVQTFGDVQMAQSPEDEKKVMHASLNNGQLSLMASDGPPGREVAFGNNVHLSIVGPDGKQLIEFFNKLAEGGTIDMPLEKQFWGDTFGMLTDKFGVHWMINISHTA
jgi:PhnB protein